MVGGHSCRKPFSPCNMAKAALRAQRRDGGGRCHQRVAGGAGNGFDRPRIECRQNVFGDGLA
ncbi:MAG: hypothetical protein ACK5QX_08115, partial [bacterium]